MKKPRVSVLMPAYNAEKYLAPAIESILGQTFTDLELVIINDGSTDKTAEIVRGYAARDKRVRFIDNETNSGLISVLNQGLKLCRGEYIARMDSDDISMPSRIGRQVEYMDANPSVAVLGTWFRMFGDATDVVRHPVFVGPLELLRGCVVGHPTVMMRADAVRAAGMAYDADYQHCEDYDLWARMAMANMRIENIPDVLLMYRVHGAAVSQKFNKIQMQNTDRVRHRLMSFILNTDEYDEYLAAVSDPMRRWGRTRIWLFGVLPLVKIKSFGDRSVYYLFHVLPVLSVRRGNRKH